MEPKMQLKDTVELMTSEDAVDQFKAEYYQLENRLVTLNGEIMKWDLNHENANMLVNHRNLLGEKMGAMRNYLFALKRIAKEQNIEL